MFLLQIEGLGRPVSRILLYPAIHLRGLSAPGSSWRSRAYQPGLACGCRDNLACSHRSFTWPVPRGIPPVGSYPTLSPITCAGRGCPLRPSAGLLSVALDVTADLRRAAPRVLSPSGLSGRGFRALASPDFALRTGLKGRYTATGRTAQTYPDIIPQGVPYGVTSPASGAGPGVSRRRVVRVRSWSVSGAARLSGRCSSASASAGRP